MAFATIAAMASCNKTEIDPIWETTPVTNAFYTDANGNENFPLELFHKLGEAGDTVAQLDLLDQHRKPLTSNIVRQYPQITNEKNIHLILGSGFAKDVKSGNGQTYSGKFKNELIIILDDPAIKDTLFLACGNGMLSPLEFYDRHDFGHGDPWIEVNKNDSYAKFFPETWGELAKDADVGIRNEKGEKVTPRVYLHYLGKYVSMLRPGDKINSITGEVRDENWKVVNFESRQSDTKAANDAIQKAKATKSVKKNKTAAKGQKGGKRTK